MTRALPPRPLDRQRVDDDVDHALTSVLYAASTIEESREHEDHGLPEAGEAIRRLRKAAKHLRRALGELRTMPGGESS